MSNTVKFDTALPALYKDNWKEAYRSEKEDSPRLSTYQSPGGEPVPFIYKSIRFAGGQSVDTAEYPFWGLWSNEALNEKPQTLNVQGFLRGAYYLQQRTALVDALRSHTSDETPGFLDLPLWGRFPVVVADYSVDENADEGGQCAVSLILTRAGVAVSERAKVLDAIDFTKPESVPAVAIEEFSTLEADTPTLWQAFGQIKEKLLTVTGRIQGTKTLLNNITNEITGITNLIAQGISAPGELAQALTNAVFAIAGGVMEIAEATENETAYLFRRDNKKNAALQFLAERNFTVDTAPVTARQEKTKQAAENLYRTISLASASKILMKMDDVTYQKMSGYWVLYEKLEAGISLENPDVYQTISEMRSTLSEALRNTAMSTELKQNIAKPVPLAFLSHHLGCGDERLRAMNFIEDSFLVSGEIAYV